MEELKNNDVEQTEGMTDTAADETAGEQGENPEREEQTEKLFTQDEVNEIVQKRLARQNETFMKNFQNAQKMDELEEREKNITMRELKADTAEKLAAAGLPADLAKLVNYENKEACEESLKNVCDVFNASLGEALKISARQETPKEGYSGSPDPLAAAFGVKR